MMMGLLNILAAGTLALCAVPASATTFVDGEFFSFSQTTWGTKPPIGYPNTILLATNPHGGTNFDFVYPLGVTLGLQFLQPSFRRVIFDTADDAITFMPQPGPPAAFDNNLLNPGGPGQSTSSGVFGGEVLALFLNIDFNDAGFLPHPIDVTYGDLIIGGYDGGLAGLDGLTIRQFRDIANTAIGGGSTAFSIPDLSAQLRLINGAFEGGFHTIYADQHLSVSAITPPPPAVPEPATWSLLLIGFGIVGGAVRRHHAAIGATVAWDERQGQGLRQSR